MARLRTIKPSFFTNEDLVEIEPLGRLLFAGLWCHADREGRLEDRPRKLKMEILPADNCDVDALLDALAERGFIARYQIGGRRYIGITARAMECFAASDDPSPEREAWNAVAPAISPVVFVRDGYRCRRCGATDDLTIDHIQPLARGGGNDLDNLQTLCRSCNSRKGAR